MNHEVEQLFDAESRDDSQDVDGITDQTTYNLTHSNDIEDDVNDEYDYSDSFIDDGSLESDGSTEDDNDSDDLLMKENHPDQENHAIPNMVFFTPSVDTYQRKPGRPAKTRILENSVEDHSKRKPGRPPKRRPLTEITQNIGDELLNIKKMRGKLLQTKTCNAVRRSVGNVQPPNNNSSKSNVPRARTPTKLSHVSKQTSIVVRSDVCHNSVTPRPNEWPCLADISTCKPKDATSTPADAVVRSVRSVLPHNNNRTKRTRTPTQFSLLSKGNINVELSESARITLTPRPRGRPHRTEISTRTPFQDVTPVGSLTFKLRILNGTDLDKTVGDTTTKGKSIRDKHASWFMNQTPVNFNK
ncbi:hypothetical protein Tco_1424854 [Tanacetum coccineum]